MHDINNIKLDQPNEVKQSADEFYKILFNICPTGLAIIDEKYSIKYFFYFKSYCNKICFKLLNSKHKKDLGSKLLGLENLNKTNRHFENSKFNIDSLAGS